MNGATAFHAGTDREAAERLTLAFDALDAILLQRLSDSSNELDPLHGMHVNRNELVAALSLPARKRSRTLPGRTVTDLAEWLDPALMRRWGLAPLDSAALLMALAPELDSTYERVYAFLQDDLALIRPRVQLVVDVCTSESTWRSGAFAHFLPGAPLRRLGLMCLDSSAEQAPLAGRILRVSNAVLGLALPDRRLDSTVGGGARWVRPIRTDAGDEGTSDPLPPSRRSSHISWIYTADRPRLLDTPAALAQQLSRPVLVASLANLGQQGLDSSAVLVLVQHAAVRDAPLVVDVEDLAEAPAGLSMLFDASVDAQVDLYVLATRPPPVAIESRVECKPLGLPTQAERAEVWMHELLAHPSGAPTKELCERLGRMLPLSLPQIRSAAAAAGSSSIEREAVLVRSALAQYRSPSELGEHVPVIRTMEDLRFPEKTTRELVELAKKMRVHEAVQASSPLAGGFVVLFTGPPGTGKTAAAEVLAYETRRDIFRVNASQTLDRYVGGTEKQIDRVFALVEHARVLAPETILLIDEADWLFASRVEGKDSHDHYLNVRVSHLLQHLERFRGVAILTTNFPTNLDDAFRRRWFQHVTFHKPDAQARLRIWERTLARGGVTLEIPCLPTLADAFPITGGSIHNVVLHASYLALAERADLNVAHLVRGLVCEYQKLGQELTEEEVWVRLDDEPERRRSERVVA